MEAIPKVKIILSRIVMRGMQKSSKGKKGQGRIAVTYKRKAPNKRKEIRLSFLHVVNAFAD